MRRALGLEPLPPRFLLTGPLMILCVHYVRVGWIEIVSAEVGEREGGTNRSRDREGGNNELAEKGKSVPPLGGRKEKGKVSV